MKSLAIILGVAAAALALGDTTYTDFNYSDSIWFNTSPILSVGAGYEPGFEFQATESGLLSGITIAVGDYEYNGGTNNVPTNFTVNLYNGAANDQAITGALIASGTGPTTGTSPANISNSDLVTISSFAPGQNAVLTQGDYYWIQAVAPSNLYNMIWYENSIGVTGATTENGLPYESVPAGAFSIQVTPQAVPEPFTMTLGVAGVGLAVRRRIRMAASGVK